MNPASKFGQSAWYIRNTSTPDESLRPKSTMERLTFSLSGSALAKSINDRQGEEMSRPNLDPPKSVHSYDSFMKKHLSNYGYYGNISRLQMELGEYDHRLGANDPTDFPGERFKEKELESNPSDSTVALVDDLMTRTTQIVLDPESGNGPKLKEPRSLYQLSDFQNEAKYPSHIQVVMPKPPETLKVKPPSEPEPLYQPTGNEEMPQPVEPGSGQQVVYFNDPGEEEFFTRSRVNGRFLSNEKAARAAARASNRPDHLQFESRFESGNLLRATRVADGEYELQIRNDLYTNRHTQWYNFQIKNMKANKTYRFTITNLSKPTSLYNLGLMPLVYSEQKAKDKKIGWHRCGENIKYYRSQSANPDGSKRKQYCLTFTISFPYDNDTVYLAHDYPYTYTDLQNYLSELTNDPKRSCLVKSRILCKTLASNSVHILTISNPSKISQSDDKNKKMILITARVHPGETNGSWMMKGFLDYITSADPDANTLRDHFIFKVIPMLNPDGVIVGNYRCSLAGRDLNRRYKTALRDAFPPVWHTRLMVQRITRDRSIDLYIDLHGHSRKHNVFMYGCQSSLRAGDAQIFPYMMGLNAKNTFNYDSCKYKLQANREGTGRILMHRLGIQYSYTLEASFGGSTIGNRAGTHLGICDLENMGKHICDTLLDFFDPDPTKRIYCQNEILAKIRADLIRKYGEGNLPTDPNKLYDLESDTSGSDSSSDEGLPAHIEHIQQSQVKKTKRKTRKERQRLYDNRLPVKDTKSRPKSAEQIKPNKAILEVPRTVPNNRQAPIRRQLPQETEKSVAIKKHTARHLVPLVPKDATLVHFTEKKPRHHPSTPKKIIDIFNLQPGRGPRPTESRAESSKMTHQQRYNWHTHWNESGAYDKTELPGTRQTKYQAFSIENYLKHLLKTNHRTHKHNQGIGVSLGQLLSATQGTSSAECKSRLYEIIRERRYDEMPVINDYESVRAMRELLMRECQTTPRADHHATHTNRPSMKPRLAMAQVRHY